MRLSLLMFALLLLLPGCADVSLTSKEKNVLEETVRVISQIAPRYAELEGLNENLERGRNFISFSKNLGQSGATPIMNPDYFWFKVSLVEKPVEAVDLQPPVFTIFFPEFKKYLKLRLTMTNRELASEIAGIVQRTALKAGGTDVRWNNLSMPARGRRMSRFGGY